jgi:hypothetical protein
VHRAAERGFTVKTPCFTVFLPQKQQFFELPRIYGDLKDLAVLRRKCAHTRRVTIAFERTYAIFTVLHGESVANKELNRILGAFWCTLTHLTVRHGGCVAMIGLTNINMPH